LDKEPIDSSSTPCEEQKATAQGEYQQIEDQDQNSNHYSINGSDGEQEVEEEEKIESKYLGEPEEEEPRSKLQQSSRRHYQQQLHSKTRDSKVLKVLQSKELQALFPSDRMSRWQVALISAMMSQAGCLMNYFTFYLLGKVYYYQDFAKQKKASSFII